jgi:multicomponent Na+:H+ antiporter subunit E
MSMRSFAVVPRALALFGFWLLLWGEWSAANVTSGIFAVLVVSWLFGHQQPARYSLRPWGALKLLGFVLYSLITSSLRVAVAVVSPTPNRTVTSIQRVQLERGSVFVAAIVANAITLTPGTMTLDIDRDNITLSVHVLGEVDTQAFRSEVLKLERLVDGAFGAHRRETAS